MRKLLILLLSCVVCGVGCSLPGQKCEYGYEWRMYRPPIIRTEGQVVVQGESGVMNTQAVGTSSGPVHQGQFLQGKPGTNNVAPLFMGRQIAESPGPCPPPPCVPRLTVDEWRALQTNTQALPMPKAQ